jgi:PAS domain-containing protein
MDKIEEIPVSQFHEINKLLLAYSAGNYNVKGRISANRDAIDTIILAVNMLGEEIVARTVSRDYFSSIYNAIKDLVIVCDSKGIIKDNNNAVIELLGEIKGKKFSSIIDKAHYPVWKSMQKHLAKGHKKYTVEINFSLFNSQISPFSCSFSNIFSGCYC